MCSVLVFPSESDKLKSLLSERNHFDSVLFIFDGSRRYKLSCSTLGITRVQDLLSPLGGGLFRNSPFWLYYLYPCCSHFSSSIDGLCGEVIRKSGFPLQPESCHIFVDRSLCQLKILYTSDGEYIVEQRRLSSGIYQLTNSERASEFIPVSWSRLNELLTIHKAKKTRNKLL